MPMPNYTDIFGNGPVAAFYALQDRDNQQAADQLKMQQDQEALRTSQLANMFTEQSNPLRLRQQELSNQQMEQNNISKGYENELAGAQQPYKLEQVKQEMALKASKAELDQLEYQAQRTLYDPKASKEAKAEAEQMMLMHKDFMKIREQSKATAASNAQQHQYRMQEEAARASHAQQLAESKAQMKQATFSGINSVFQSVQSGKTSPANAAAAFGAAAMQAQASGDEESAMLLQQAASRMEQLATNLKPNPGQGQIDMGQVSGMPTVPQRPPAFPAPQQQQQAPSLPSGWTMK